MELFRVYEELVNGMEGLPGVELPPAVDVEHIYRAEEALGVTVPKDLGLIAMLSDGLSLEHGLFRFLPFDPSSPVSFATMNDPTVWQWAYAGYHPAVLDFVYFAVTWKGSLFGYHRPAVTGILKTRPRTHVVVPRAAGGVFPSAYDVIEILRTSTGPLRETGKLNLHPRDAAVLEMHGPLPPDTIVMPGPRNLIDDDGSLEGSQPMDTVTALIAIGELTGQALKMPSSAHILGIEPWVDELGRPRLKWRTQP